MKRLMKNLIPHLVLAALLLFCCLAPRGSTVALYLTIGLLVLVTLVLFIGLCGL